jgi:hypothetical protein
MNPFRAGTMRAHAFSVLSRRGPLDGDEWADALGIRRRDLSAVIRDGLRLGVFEREVIDDGYRYSVADNAVESYVPMYFGRYASVWGYAQGVET